MKINTKWTLISISTVYIAGFFILQPLGMYSQNMFLKNTAYKTSEIIYGSWLFALNKNNLLRKLYISNGKYWCNKISTCEVIENKNI